MSGTQDKLLELIHASGDAIDDAGTALHRCLRITEKPDLVDYARLVEALTRIRRLLKRVQGDLVLASKKAEEIAREASASKRPAELVVEYGDDKWPMVAGGVLSLARKCAGMTQRDVAKIVGCSDGMVAHIENGFKRPGPELATRIARLVKQIDADLEARVTKAVN